MLQELSIRNFAIIEDLAIGFEPGLTIISGETGAGKSIIINAVNLLLGSRASAALIRTGAENAELEALFDIPAASRAARQMLETGYDPAEGLLVRRVVAGNDRHRIYINGRLATVQVLGSISADLASISGQHANQLLLREDEHLFILDQFGGLMALRDNYFQCYRDIQPLIRKEAELLQRQSQQAAQIELLRYQLQEIEAAELSAGEDEALEKERLRLRNGELIFETAQHCADQLYNQDGAVVDLVGQMKQGLEKVGRLDDRLAPLAAEMQELAWRIDDLAGNLRTYLQRLDMDPRQLESVEARLDRINKLKRKHGGSLDAVFASAQRIRQQLDEVEHIDSRIEQVRADLKTTHARLCAMARQLSDQRRKAAEKLSRLVEKELGALKMAGTRFSASLQGAAAVRENGPYLTCDDNALLENGMDRAAFMIAPNVGEAVKPLAAIASGGELSRVVLALKAILARNDAVETIIFDEVDAGIGGAAADVVGRKLAALARRQQVLCITHLPQIARYGDHHYRIAKSVSRGRTRTTITHLSETERVEEIARMLGGERITSATLEHARELLDSGRSGACPNDKGSV